MTKLQWICFFILATNVVCQLPFERASTSSLDLDITKISKVMKESDPSGRNHNTKVAIAPHPPLYNIVEWKLVFQSPGGDTTTLNKLVDSSKASRETEFLFEGNLPDSKYIFLQARDSRQVIAMDYLGLPITDLQSNVAWVGDDKSSLSSSVRVAVGERLTHIAVGDKNCSSLEGVCYFISPNPKPTFIERCVKASLGSSKTVQLCDERETSFTEMLQKPSLFLKSEGTMEVTVYTDNDDFQIEVLIFDPEDNNIVFSNSSYKCYSSPKDQQEKGKYKCLHDFILKEEKQEIMVLVVQIDDDGYVCGSSLQSFIGNLPNPETVSIIVSSFIGTMIGLALIILLIILFLRRKQIRRRKEREETEKNKDAREPCLLPKRVIA